ncbi:hypothetical protein CH263_19245 [Rhodococcus sp. 06-1059B-a]|nr:NAD(P)/FAD-dependent oxidoreductase [Rhodococcus sp. 06-1059B-a]OZD62888.1 hypothetical protein CH263_19245 [Rhodococcus sp. 06-1059B-a]
MPNSPTNASPTYDAIIVGGGPAGASAAILLARSMRRVLVVDAGKTRNGSAEQVHNYLGLDGISPDELHRRGRHEAEHYGCTWKAGAIDSVRRHSGGTFELVERSGSVHRARAVVVATGLRDELPEVEGIEDSWGGNIAHCPYCHGYEVRGGHIGVLAGPNRSFSLHQAELLRLWSDDVIFFPDAIDLAASERASLSQWGVRIVDGRVRRVRSVDSKLTVQLVNGEDVDRTAVFVGPRFSPNHALLFDLGCTHNDDGWITVDQNGATSVAGVWAAGNVVDSLAQLVHAAAQGTRTGIAVNRSLLEQDMSVLDRQSP